MTDEQLQSLIAQFRKETEDLIEAVVYQWYFNDGQVWASTTEVLNLITSENRKAYRPINVAGTLYWFKPDLTTLEPIFGTLNLTVANGTVFYRKSAGDGPPEVQTLATLRADLNIPDAGDIATELEKKVDKADNYSLVANSLILKIHDKFADDEAAVIQAIQDFLDALVLTDNNFTDAYKAKLDLLHQDVYTINLPTGDVSERAAGATFGDGIITYSVENPTGWSLAAAANPNDLLITHNLGRKIAHVDVSYTEDGVDVLLMGNLGYTGRQSTSNTVTIKGLSTKAFPLIINLIFA